MRAQIQTPFQSIKKWPLENYYEKDVDPYIYTNLVLDK